MKLKRQRAVWIWGIFILLFQTKTQAQDTATTGFIEPVPISITYAKTTNLIFPYAIKSMDKGSRDVLVQKAGGVENVLQLKAAIQGFAQTNLTVVTADGSLYSYVLNYVDNPSELNIKMQNTRSWSAPLAVFTPDATNDIVHKNAEKVFSKKAFVNRIKDKKNNVGLSLNGIYAQDELIYFQFELINNSWLDYDIKLFRFFIKDSKKSRRTASQEIEINPVYVLGNTSQVGSRSQQMAVIAVPRFTIPDKKIFLVQMQEQNGGRNLELNMRNKDIIRAWRIF